MSSKVQYITTALMLILLALLLGIFIGYLSTRELDTSTHVSHNSGEKSLKESGESVTTNTNSGDNVAEATSIISGEVFDNASVEVITSELVVEKSEPKKDEKQNKNDKREDKQPVISEEPLPDNVIDVPIIIKEEVKEPESVIASDVETSNEEKRQVLNELDSTLQGLLEAVGKVPTVDEEKLDASLKESEVSP